ncbi:hypothetical protein C2G38_2250851 [Gigaspora rosea]|uniref:Methyltransferase type 11 domain-containing protein n=1 Tax=Gigaspora rosea TaxID=44941 RepID=A0A397UJK3_9GLOM|nr:hypothetical protein C2G38_2250851 [Gigaspora rosea]
MSTMNNINVNSTTFSDSDYNSAAYNTYHPTYSSRLFSKVCDYYASHFSSFSTTLDVTTGTGYVTKELSKKNSNKNLSQFQESTFDLVTVGQAVHWFDGEKFFNEAWRVLKQSRTLAIWGYSYHVVDGYPAATKKFMKLVSETFGIVLLDELFRNIICERHGVLTRIIWSSIKKNQKVEDPVNKLFEELKEEEGWKGDQILIVSWLFVFALAEKQ